MKSQAQASPEKPRGTNHVVSAIIGLASLAIIAATIWVFVVQSRNWGGVDNYFYLLYANDLTEDAASTPWVRYFYFPGTYTFWHVIAAFAGRDIAPYQTAFVGLCLTNAALVALTLRSAGCHAVVAATSFWAYMSLASRVQLQEMTTEPICTTPVLMGIFLWLTFTQRNKERWGWVCLGIGYGLAVFAKQQGALLAIGAIGLLLGSIQRPFEWRIIRDLLIMTVVAVVTFVCAFGLEGGGFRALQYGLQEARRYQVLGDLKQNLNIVFAGMIEWVAFFCLAFLAGVAATFLSARKTVPVRQEILRLWGLAGTTAIVPISQFFRRGYPHYALLSVPFVVITIGLAAKWTHETCIVPMARGIHERLARVGTRQSSNGQDTAKKVAFIFGSALQFVFLCGLMLHVNRDLQEKYKNASRRVLPHVGYASQCRDITPGKRLLLLTSKFNALHWACKTHARGTQWGYAFNLQENPQDYIAEIQKPDLEQVFVFDTRAGSYEQQARARSNWSPFFAELTRLGFAKIRSSSLGTLYKRTP